MMNLLKLCLFLTIVLTILDINFCDPITENLSTIEPEPSIGCLAPDIRFARPRQIDITTESPYAEFETTQIFLPEDLTTTDIDIIQKVDIDLNSDTLDEQHTLTHHGGHKYAEINPYRIDSDNDDIGLHDSDEDGLIDGHDVELTRQANINNNNRRRGKKRRFTGGKRRRVENEHGGRGGGGRGGRYERNANFDDNTEVTDDINDDNNDDEKTYSIPPMSGKNYFVEAVELLNVGKDLKMKVALGKKMNNGDTITIKNIIIKNKVININDGNSKNIEEDNSKNVVQENKNNDSMLFSIDIEENNQMENLDDIRSQSNGNDSTININGNLQRVKRKSGKTTGALSRPKGGGDTGSKSTSRKDKNVEEEGGYVPLHSEDEDSSEEKESESVEHSHFTEVSEIRFPGEVGPLGDRRLCKIRCSKGKWVGPLCATNEEDEHGNIKFQPLYKSCHVNRIPPHLLLSYRNISVNVGWDLPHGHSLQARCKDLGLYKLLGESRVLCSNGLWAPRMPSCVPTTILTNYSDDSPPSIRIKIGAGSGAFEPSGVLAVLPGSTIHLDCMYPRRRGNPEWTWTGWFNQANPVGWSTIPEDKGTKYRLTIKDIQNQDSGTYTCASPRGLTNSIVIVVATSQCPQLPDPVAPLSLRLEGNKLGQRALYRCPLGYTIEGTANSTCLASGNWSSPPPICHPVQCPPLFLEDPHLSLTELNTSAWGRAVFKCSWGFRLSGPPGLECEPTGVWSGPVPRCRAIQCPQPLVPINGRIDGTSGSSSHRRYAVGALVTFSCTEGHLLVGEASIVCTETGFWSHPPPFCKSQCPYPGDPPNGLIAPLKFHYDPGDLLSVQCRPGFIEYSISGPPERPRCLPDGNWSGPVPQCRSYEEV